MTQKEHFLELYNYVINSEDEEKMHVLGNVVKEMMMHIIGSNQTLAQEFIEKLESVKWHNYITDKETEAIASKMKPIPLWSKSVWKTKMEASGMPMCEEPYYNENALYVTMSMLSSDDAETFREMAGITDDAKMFSFIHSLALNRLKDKDKVYDIRNYFKL